MRLRFFLGAGAVVLAATGFGQSVEEFQKLMRPAAAADGKLQKTIGTDLAAAPAVATELSKSFKEIEAFWAKHNAADAQTFAKNIQQLADEVASLAKTGDQDGAAAIAEKIGANCQGCHMVHRDKGPDGNFINQVGRSPDRPALEIGFLTGCYALYSGIPSRYFARSRTARESRISDYDGTVRFVVASM